MSSRQYSGALLILLAAFLAAGASVAQPLAFGFRPAPPYVLQQADGGLSGLEYELVLAAAQAGGLELKPEIAPLGRLVEDFRRGRSQGIVPANAEMALPGCLTDTLLVYRNIAFSLRQRGLKPATFADLAGYDVVAFQNARRMLGPDFDAVQRDNPRYAEVANQLLQLRALFSQRTDFVIADRRIFRYLVQRPDDAVDTAQPVAEHDLFPPSPNAAAFREPAQCRAFNAGLARIRRDGAFDAILRRWDTDAN